MTIKAPPIRLFAAIVPGPETLLPLQERLKTLKRETWAGDVRWTSRENIHMTLRFFGETEESRLDSLKRALIPLNKLSPPFVLELDRVIFLPKPAKTRVVAAGIQPDIRLANLALALETIARDHDFKAERRPFRPHLTLGRCKPTDVRSGSRDYSLGGINLRINGFHLIQSTLSSRGACYSTLEKIDFHP
jgi:RNA 2',3'-cyclic 3'-phosphodiesterase